MSQDEVARYLCWSKHGLDHHQFQVLYSLQGPLQDVCPMPSASASTVMGPMAAAVALAAAQAAMTAAERAAAEIAEFRAHLGGDSVHVEVDPEAPPAIKSSPSLSGGDGAAPEMGYYEYLERCLGTICLTKLA